MPNLRIISDNAADRAALSASSTAGALAVDNLKNDRKGQLWRSSGPTASLFFNSSVDSLNGWSIGPNLTRVGGTTAPDGTNSAVVYTGTVSGNAYISQLVNLAALTQYTISVWARLVSGSEPISGSMILSDHDTDGDPAVIERTGRNWSGLAPEWKQFFFTFTNVAAATGVSQYFCVDAGNGAQIAFWGARMIKTPAATIKAVWPDIETVGGVAFPFCNLSPTATMRVRLSREAAATNELKYSEQFDNAIWGKTRATVTPNIAIAPDATRNADELVEDSTATSDHYLAQAISVAAGTPYVLSVFAKAVSRSNIELWIPATAFSDATTRVVRFNLSTGVATSTGGSGAVPIITPLAGGWYRCAVEFVATAAVSTSALIRLHNGASSFYTGDGVSGLYIFGALFAVGKLSSYFPTVAAPALRPAGYIDTWQSYDYDSGAVPACPAAAIRLRGFTAAQAASAYAYGGGACARHWLPAQMLALGMAIDIADPANLQGYIEAARLVVGAYWSPTNNPDYGASMLIQDASKHYRTDGGDLLTDIGTRARKLPLNLSAMPPADRTALVNIIRSNGMAGPLLISLFPEDVDLELERDHTIFGKLSQISATALPFYGAYAMPLEIEEI